MGFIHQASLFFMLRLLTCPKIIDTSEAASFGSLPANDCLPMVIGSVDDAFGFSLDSYWKPVFPFPLMGMSWFGMNCFVLAAHGPVILVSKPFFDLVTSAIAPPASPSFPRVPLNAGVSMLTGFLI